MKKVQKIEKQKKSYSFLKKRLIITLKSVIIIISNKERHAADIGAYGGYYEKV